jgi:energy-coupling factor transporter transmembrane protein EcfT
MSSYMPTPEQILSGLTESANTWRPLSEFWHIYFAVFVIALVLGLGPSKRLSGILLALPFLSVSIVSFLIPNPFNGIVFAIVSVLLVVVSLKLPKERVQVAPKWITILGTFMFIFGWIYPHFLDPSSSLSFLYSAPTGVVPCATLSIGIGLALIMNLLDSRKLPLILGVSGVTYGIIGAMQLGVTIDWVLFAGAIMTTVFIFVGKKAHKKNST